MTGGQGATVAASRSGALPRLLLLTDRQACARPLLEVLAAAVAGGARAVVLRERDLPPADRARLAAQIAELLAPVDGLLVLAGAGLGPPGAGLGPPVEGLLGPPDAGLGPPGAGLDPPGAGLGPPGAGQVPTRAVHLAAGEPEPWPRPALLGRSCHDVAEVAAAGRQRCDWVTVSPVHPTASKPGYGPALGPAGLAGLVAVPGAPRVFALGGVTVDRVAGCLQAGAYGIAVMGEVMRAADPAGCVARLVERTAMPAGALPAAALPTAAAPA